MITLVILWFIANRHLFVHDTNDTSAYEVFYIVDQQKHAAREAAANDLINKIESSIEHFTSKDVRKAIPKKVGAAKFYAQGRNHVDLEYDEEDYFKGHKRSHQWATHGTHGSKGQRKARFKTLAYKEAREYKRSRYQLEQTQLTIS